MSVAKGFFGDDLHGGRPVYYLYMDEAGTSKNEPITIVVSVIVHADRHWKRMNESIHSLIDRYVPEKLKPSFIFHAKDIWGNKKYREEWSLESRFALICEMAKLPRLHQAALAVGKVRRDADIPSNNIMRAWDLHHLYAFHTCLGRANKYVRDWAGSDEMATVVAEDVPDKRKFLKMLKNFPVSDITIDSENIYAFTGSDTNSGKIDRIIDTIHFTEKNDAPLLQISDACAFVFRRYLSEQSRGPEMLKEMLGSELEWEDWQGPTSNITFSFNPAHRYPSFNTRIRQMP